MDKKTLSIILGVLLIVSFFLPYLSVGGFIKASGFDIISGKDAMGGEGSSSGSADKYIMLLTPVAGLLLLFGALNNNNYILGKPVLGVLALFGVLYPLIRGVIDGGTDGLEYIFRFLGVGFWLGVAGAILTIVYNPPVKKTSSP